MIRRAACRILGSSLSEDVDERSPRRLAGRLRSAGSTEITVCTVTRPASSSCDPRLFTGSPASSWQLVTAPLTLPAWAADGSDRPPASENTAPTDQAVAKLIESLRAAEKQFANLETVVKKKRQRPDRSTPIKARRGKAIIFANFHEEVAARTVVQGDLFFSKMTLSRKSTNLRNVTVERTVAYDGRQTRTVEAGSAANLHEGKSILVRPLPPQAWPLGISVSLSDFLAGSTSADEPQRTTVDSLLTDNVRAPIAAIDPKIAGEETLKGLACLRLEFEQEDAQDGERYRVRLWLAKERHLIPVRQEVSVDSDNGPVLAGESASKTGSRSNRKSGSPNGSHA